MTLLFVDASETVIIDQAYQFMVIQVAFFIPLTAVNVIRLLIQGMGYSKLAVFAGVFEMIARGGFGCFWCRCSALTWRALPAPPPGFWRTASSSPPTAR